MVAIKLLRNLFDEIYQSCKLLTEIRILKQLTQINNGLYTTSLLDIIIEDDPRNVNYAFIVMEFVDSDLKQVCLTANNIEFSEEHVVTILYNLLCAINFIHSANVMHRDIKPGNILVDSNCHVKLCDFGLSRTVPGNLLIPQAGDLKVLCTKVDLNKENSQELEKSEQKGV